MPRALPLLLAAALGIGLVGSQLVDAAPPGKRDFTFSPSVPQVGQPVTFTGTNLRPGDQVSWDFEGDGIFDATGVSAQHAYSSPGQRTVRMRVHASEDAPDEFTDVTKTIRVNSPPTASFTISPNPAGTGQTVTFNATARDPDGNVVDYEWDLDGNGSFETDTGRSPTATKTYSSPGTVDVRLRVTDNDGATAESSPRSLTVSNTAPIASIAVSPNPAVTGQTVVFDASGSSAPAGGSIVKYEWDLDNDGSFEASGVRVSRSFPTPGSYRVWLRVTDSRGQSQLLQSQPIAVLDRAPVASFIPTPGVVAIGQPVQFSSTSADPDTPIASQAWDLDDDGQFDDAQGPVVFSSFATAGLHVVRLKVTDSEGASDVASGVVVVVAPPRVLSATGPELLSPFPILRIAGRFTRAGTRIDLLAVRAPAGSRVTVRCRGRGCPFRARTRSAVTGRARFRFPRLLRPGARITVTVTSSDKVGKYTSLLIRRGRPPKRRDLCLWPGAGRPAACPTS